MSPDIVIGFNHEDREAGFPRQNGGGKTYGARADHDDVGFKIPLLRQGPAFRLCPPGGAERQSRKC